MTTPLLQHDGIVAGHSLDRGHLLEKQKEVVLQEPGSPLGLVGIVWQFEQDHNQGLGVGLQRMTVNCVPPTTMAETHH